MRTRTTSAAAPDRAGCYLRGVCGRVTLTKDDIDEVAAELAAEIARENVALYRKRYNVAPSDLHWIVEYGADRRVVVPAIWGYRASGKPLINVRGEQVGKQIGSGAGFRDAFRSRRCAVITDGFFEWSAARDPTWYHRSDNGLVLLAGLYQPPDASAGGGAVRPRFTILTTRANQLVAPVHNRMPVVLPAQRLDVWLTAAPEQAGPLLVSAPEDALMATRVSRRVNSVKNDDPACLTPVMEGEPAPDSDRQGKLFQ
jgi:putative SOS response-associated peptidase YedK